MWNLVDNRKWKLSIDSWKKKQQCNKYEILKKELFSTRKNDNDIINISIRGFLE